MLESPACGTVPQPTPLVGASDHLNVTRNSLLSPKNRHDCYKSQKTKLITEPIQLTASESTLQCIFISDSGRGKISCSEECCLLGCDASVFQLVVAGNVPS
jgi:hypothetical protein